MKTLEAHVQNGHIVLDEPVDLADGTAVEALLVDDREDQTELENALAESVAQFASGEIEDAHAFARRLVARCNPTL